MSKQQTISRLCSLLQLSEKESQIYSELLSFQSGVTVAVLSERTSIPRGTLYGLLDSLVIRGIVLESTTNGKHYRPAPLDELEQLLKAHVSQAQQDVTDFIEMKSEFKNIVNNPIIHPKFTYAEGLTAMIQTYYSTLQNQEKFIRAIFPESSVIDTLGKKVVEDFKVERKRRGIQVRTLVASKNILRDSLLESSVDNNMEIRNLPNDYSFSATFLIFDNKVNFFTVGSELISARIESREYSETMKSLFDTIWDSV
jgi:sugar-specific transcriptional regulator TrmB